MCGKDGWSEKPECYGECSFPQDKKFTVIVRSVWFFFVFLVGCLFVLPNLIYLESSLKNDASFYFNVNWKEGKF